MENQKPNIVFLVNDHQAYYRHGWDGGVQPKRPHFTRLAREGVSFDRAYTVCPLCTPARRSMMTGLYSHNHGFRTLDESENSAERDHGIFFNLMAERGYRLYYYGKWHAGPGTAHDFGCEGFSYPGFGNPYTTPEYKEYLKVRGLPPASFNIEHVFMEPVSPDEPEPGPGYRCMAANFHPHVTGTLETPPDTHESFFLANLACAKLEELADRDQPFFLRVDFYGPHAPYLAGKEYIDMYPPDSIQEYGSFNDNLAEKPAVYRKEWNTPLGRDNRLITPNPLKWPEWQRILSYVYGQISQIDAAGGKILDALDRFGLAENTLVLWTADHGDPVAAHGGHFGKEAFLSEEVLRIPLAMRWPQALKPRQTSLHLVSNMDMPVTILDTVGASFTDRVDGRSLLELFSDGSLKADDPSWRDSLMCETHGHHGEKVEGRALINQRHRYSRYHFLEKPDYVRDFDNTENMEELYDLEKDPYQLHNLANNQDNREIRDHIKALLAEWMLKSGDTARFDWD